MAVSILDETLVLQVSRAAVEQLAPNEIESFRATSRAFLADPRRFDRQGKRKSGPLGLGLDVVCDPLTPFVLSVVTDVVTELVTPPARRGLAALWHWCRRMLSRPWPGRQVSSSAASQLDPARIGQLVQLVADRRGSRQDQQLVVDLVTHELCCAFGHRS